MDLVHLAAQTMGDRALEREILVLLHAQIMQMRPRLDDAGSEARAAIAHAVAGSARNVGAFSLAEAASALERDPSDAALRHAVIGEMQRVSAFLRPLVGAPSAD